jgi:shikimate kinase
MIDRKINDKKIIAITGLMGAGKTTLGYKLANKIGVYFVDSDQEIEDLEKKSTSEIFSTKGEKYFRDLEKNLIKEIVNRDEELVLSLGGGAFIEEETRQILKEKAITIWLNTDIEIILKRVGTKKTRPILNNGNKRVILGDLAKKRNPFYSQSDIHINSNQNNRDIILEMIICELNKLKNNAT